MDENQDVPPDRHPKIRSMAELEVLRDKGG